MNVRDPGRAIPGFVSTGAVMDVIFERKSIRSYQKRKVEKETLVRLCHAGMHAPSARNARPWRFLVIEDELRKEGISRMSPNASFASQASAVIMVLLDREKITGVHTKWQQDLSAATENILLECVHLGLGGCWLGLYPDEERIALIRRELALPDRYLPFSAVSLGYPTGEGSRFSRADDSLIHFEEIF